jgi:hypothetical protein
MNPHSTASIDELSGWFAGRIPADWFAGTPEVVADRDEILVVGTLSDPELPSDATAEAAAAARVARIDGFREDTREHRMRIAEEAQHRFGRRVSWGASCGDVRKLFTTVSVPAMTRLRLEERRVLDTLVEGGVTRSLGACVWSPRSRMSGSRTCATRSRTWRRCGGRALPPSTALVRAEPHPIELLAALLIDQDDGHHAVLQELGPRRPDPILGRAGICEPRRAPDLLAGDVEIRPGEHQARRIPTIMLTALVTITRSPASRSSGALSGPRRAVSSLRSG